MFNIQTNYYKISSNIPQKNIFTLLRIRQYFQEMGNKHSLDNDFNNPEKLPYPSPTPRGSTLDLRDQNPSNTDHSGWDGSTQQLRARVNRTSSHRAYRPRSASFLRRIKSIEKRRFLERTKTETTTSAKESVKIENDNEKVQKEISLLVACARGDLSEVEKLVDSGVDVNSSNSSKMTALHYAAMHARDDVIKCLISRGAEVNTADMKGGSSAMHWVVNNSVPKYGSIEGSLTALSKAGCNVNSTDFNFATPLHIAAQKGNRNGVQVLLRFGANPDKKDITGRNCFEVAKYEPMKTFMRTLMENSPKKDNQTDVEHIYHVLKQSLPSKLSSNNDNQPEITNNYHVLESPPSSIPAPFLHVPPPELAHVRKSSPEEHIYSVPDFHSSYSPPSSLRPRSTTPSLPLPPLPRRHCQYPLIDRELHLYDVLDHFPTRKSGIPSPPRRRKIHQY